MNRYLICFLTVLLAVAGCKKNEDNTFRVDFSSEFKIQAGVGLNVPIEILIPLDTDRMDSALATRGMGYAEVSDLYLNYVGMEITRPIGRDLSFLQQVEILVRAPGLPELVLASDYELPAQLGSFVEIEPTLVPIPLYFQSDQSQLVLRFVAKDFVLQTLDMNLYQGYRVRRAE